MRVVAIVLLGLAALAAAKPYSVAKNENKARSALQHMLRELRGQSPLTSKLSHMKKSGESKEAVLQEMLRALLAKKSSGNASPLRRGEVLATVDPPEEEEMRCDAELGITVECLELEDSEEFFECAIDKAVSVEEAFAEIYKAHTDNDDELFREEEMEFVWEVRKSRLVARELKEYTEVIIDELAAYRFTDGVDWDSLSDDVKDKLEELICTYSLIRDECFNRMNRPDED